MSKIIDLKEDDSEYQMFERDLPVDLNLIDSALFVKNKQWSQSRQLKIKNQKIEIIGGRYTDEKTGEIVELSVPGEFDENILYSIVYQMYKYRDDNNLQIIPQVFICDYSALTTNLNLNRQRQDTIRESLRKLRYTLYQISEYFLTKETGELIEDDDALKINSTEKVKRISINEGINILEQFAEIKIESLDINELSSEIGLHVDNVKSIINKSYKGTKYLRKIKLNDRFYKNLVTKVYMLPSIKFLLELKGIERAIYMFSHLNLGREIYQNKNYSTNKKLVVSVGVTDIAERIPLSIDDKKISFTFARIITALSYLMSKGYIKSFYPDQKKPLRNSKFIIEFYEEQSRNNSKFNAYDVLVKKPSIFLSKPKENGVDKLKKINKEDDNINQMNIKFDTILAEMKNKLGVINNGNIELLKKIFMDDLDTKVKYNDKIIFESKGLLMVEVIKNWLCNYATPIKNLNGLLSKAMVNVPQPLYMDEYNHTLFMMYNQQNIKENEIFEAEKKKKEILDDELKYKQSNEVFNGKLSEWTSMYYKLSSEEQDKFNKLAEKKQIYMDSKKIKITGDLMYLTVILFACNKFGKEKVISIFKNSGKSLDLISIGI